MKLMAYPRTMQAMSQLAANGERYIHELVFSPVESLFYTHGSTYDAFVGVMMSGAQWDLIWDGTRESKAILDRVHARRWSSDGGPARDAPSMFWHQPDQTKAREPCVADLAIDLRHLLPAYALIRAAHRELRHLDLIDPLAVMPSLVESAKTWNKVKRHQAADEIGFARLTSNGFPTPLMVEGVHAPAAVFIKTLHSSALQGSPFAKDRR